MIMMIMMIMKKIEFFCLITSSIYIIYIMNFTFINIHNNIHLHEQEFVDVAPIWRIVFPGLHFEGECMEIKCQAYRKMVIYNCNFIQFDYIKDNKMIECPICNINITPITFGFSSCYWYINGVNSYGKQILLSSKARNCDNSLPINHGVIQWENLILCAGGEEITKLELYYVNKKCPTCNKTFNFDEIIKVLNQYNFHEDCYKIWKIMWINDNEKN